MGTLAPPTQVLNSESIPQTFPLRTELNLQLRNTGRRREY